MGDLQVRILMKQYVNLLISEINDIQYQTLKKFRYKIGAFAK